MNLEPILSKAIKKVITYDTDLTAIGLKENEKELKLYLSNKGNKKKNPLKYVEMLTSPKTLTKDLGELWKEFKDRGTPED